ncbi:hypothetical protein [Saccharothrix australiensis]|uniref:hypothetical protein n=1 Tax=Saccharothrix australiensis TaxID=2072 RepID=UPI0014777A09|nr:hypothetical protein [Saccharothrix australiensis]
MDDGIICFHEDVLLFRTALHKTAGATSASAIGLGQFRSTRSAGHLGDDRADRTRAA